MSTNAGLAVLYNTFGGDLALHAVYILLQYKTSQLPNSNVTHDLQLCSTAAPLNLPYCYSQNRRRV